MTAGGWACEGQGPDATAHPDAHSSPAPGPARLRFTGLCAGLLGPGGIRRSQQQRVPLGAGHGAEPARAHAARTGAGQVHPCGTGEARPAALLALWALAPLRFQLSIPGDDITVPWPRTAASHPILTTPAPSSPFPPPPPRSQSGGSYPDCDSPGSLALTSPHPTLPGPTPWP